MLQSGIDLITSMGTTTIDFLGDVVTNLWPLFLTLGVIFFAGGFILRKTGIGRR
jgi:hypothetical protein